MSDPGRRTDTPVQVLFIRILFGLLFLVPMGGLGLYRADQLADGLSPWLVGGCALIAGLIPGLFTRLDHQSGIEISKSVLLVGIVCLVGLAVSVARAFSAPTLPLIGGVLIIWAAGWLTGPSIRDLAERAP